MYFFINCLLYINQKTKDDPNLLMRRCARTMTYFSAVHLFGKGCFEGGEEDA